MSKSPSVSRPLYLNIEDTLAEVEITRRQLGHWQDKGLIKLELGIDSRRYTLRDIERLKVLKRLIVDQRLPLDFVKQLADQTDNDFFAPELGATQYLDINSSQMRSKDELSDQFWREFLSAADESSLEERLYDLWLMLSRVLRAKYRTGASYSNRVEEIRRLAAGMEFIGRIDWRNEDDGEPCARLDPHLENHGFSSDDLSSWVYTQRWRIRTLNDTGVTLRNAGELSVEQQQRLWPEITMEAIARMDAPAMLPSGTDFDEVPF